MAWGGGTVYRSRRVAQHYTYRKFGTPDPEPTFQVVRGWPEDCSCPSHLAIVGEGPGIDEDQCGWPFIGKSGQDLDRFLDASRIDPDTVFITNIGRTYRHGNPDPTQEDIETWEWLLHQELNAAKPYWIASVGRVSTRYFLGDVDMDTVHGIPFIVVLPWLNNGRGGRVIIIPVVHPAAGFRSTEAQAQVAYDFAQLEATIGGRLSLRDPNTADEYPNPEYRDLTNEDLGVIAQELAGGTVTKPMAVAIDTEGLPRQPWGLSFSTRPGTAFVIRKVHAAAIICFYNNLIAGIEEGRIHVILHNSLHDLRVLRELGIPLPDGSYTDTMVLSYHLCVEPQGLKPLANRHCGMEMESYDEQVSEAQDRIAVEYYETIEALTADGTIYGTPGKLIPAPVRLKQDGTPYKVQPKPVVIPPSDPISVGPFRYIEPYTILERDKETGQLRERSKQPQQVDQRIKRALADLREGKIQPANIRKRWNDTDDLVVDVVEEVLGPMREANLDDVPLERAVFYAARDADATIRIYPILVERHEAMALGYTGQIDHSIIPMVDKMQAEGIPVDRDYFIWLSTDLQRRMVEVQQEIKERFGLWINPNSGEQVADILFRPVEEGGYGLEPTKQTKGRLDPETGRMVGRRGSTQDKVLEGLRDAHPIIPLIMKYRGLNKAKTSFCDVVVRRAVLEVDIDGNDQWVIHCNFRITRVSSGRMSATGPNLMAVVGGELGEEIRAGYIAGKGFEFGEWDLNQVEMRVMASEAGDEFLISMFAANEDVHAGTASRMFKLDLPRPYNKKQVKKDQRDAAKRTGFGVITGIQAPGLVDQMRLQGTIVTEDEADSWIKDWLAACPAVSDYMKKCHGEARQHEYVRDWAGRIRYLPGINSPFRPVRAEAGRQSHSHKIQAGAQSIMKVGMASIWRDVLPYWWARGKFIVPILQVHDSLMFRMRGFSEADKGELDAQIRAAFFAANPPHYRVPLDAGNGFAETWGALEH